MSNIIHPEFSVLVVDDEQGIVNAIRRELNTPPLGRYRYSIEGFTDPAAALARAKEKTFAVVIVDYRMPQMTGLDFLKALYDIQPDCARIVLSGQTDMDALVHMINETHIYRFIPKPWSDYFLKSSLSQAIDFHQAVLRNRKMADCLRRQGAEFPASAVGDAEQILVVDDDIDVCHAVARDLTHSSRLDELFSALRVDANRPPLLGRMQLSVQISTSPVHALQMADSVSFACIIADYKMPVMDGVKLLEAFIEKQPDCTGILLSGAAGMDEVIAALDLAHIHSYLAKPWSDFELRTAVAQALTRRRLLIENRMLAELCRELKIDCPAE
jgi:DNA-binding NtrC family response regulator